MTQLQVLELEGIVALVLERFDDLLAHPLHLAARQRDTYIYIHLPAKQTRTFNAIF